MASFYGPVEGRRHDSTVLSMSKLYDVLEAHPTNLFEGRAIYGDPAYGCSRYMVCPFPNPRPGTRQALFNSRMSSVREAVEWGFGRLKTLWPFASSPSKIKVRQAPVGKIFLVAVLLTNVHCCLQPLGNQISMYFDLPPPTLDEYLGLV